MRCYDVSLPEEKDWCVPSTLQGLLRNQGHEISQQKIFQSFPKSTKRDGLIFNDSLFATFLSDFALRVDFKTPFRDFEVYQNLDYFLKQVRGEVIIGYDSRVLPESIQIENPRLHIALFLDYNSQRDLVTLAEPTFPSKSVEIPLNDLSRGITPRVNPSSGFYEINQRN
ncbi:MAG: hypothetical protein WDZ77_03085 [Candidatus Pacearchaeota archaeon]